MLIKMFALPSKIFRLRGFILFQYLVPQHLLTWIFGKLANCRVPYIKNYLIQLFMKCYPGVNMNEAVQTDPFAYDNFQSFFIRTLQPEKRPIATEHNDFISPVDGTLSQMGKIKKSTLIQAKGFEFNLQELMGDVHSQENKSTQFNNGTFLTFYLAPQDYHRVHFPLDAKLTAMTYIPGCLFSVNHQTVESVPRIFSRNERVVCYFETHQGPMVVILVGAMIVGSIHTVWAGQVKAFPKQIKTWDYSDQHLTFKKGDELGHFTVGSTVIVLLGDEINCNWNLAQKTVRVGELLEVLSS